MLLDVHKWFYRATCYIKTHFYDYLATLQLQLGKYNVVGNEFRATRKFCTDIRYISTSTKSNYS